MNDSGESHCSSPLWSCRVDGVVEVHGEVDIATSEMFRSIVDVVVGDADGTSQRRRAHLDLAGVEFIDVAGARVLVAAATDNGHSVELVVQHPPPMLKRIVELAWGHVAGLKLEETPATLVADGSPGS